MPQHQRRVLTVIKVSLTIAGARIHPKTMSLTLVCVGDSRALRPRAGRIWCQNLARHLSEGPEVAEVLVRPP